MFKTITQIHKKQCQAGKPAQTSSCMRSGFVTCLKSQRDFSIGVWNEKKRNLAGQFKCRLNDRQQ